MAAPLDSGVVGAIIGAIVTLTPTILFFRHRLRIERAASDAQKVTAEAAGDTADAAQQTADNDALRAKAEADETYAQMALKYATELSAISIQMRTIQQQLFKVEGEVARLRAEVRAEKRQRTILAAQLRECQAREKELTAQLTQALRERDKLHEDLVAAWIITDSLKRQHPEEGIPGVAAARLEGIINPAPNPSPAPPNTETFTD